MEVIQIKPPENFSVFGITKERERVREDDPAAVAWVVCHRISKDYEFHPIPDEKIFKETGEKRMFCYSTQDDAWDVMEELQERLEAGAWKLIPWGNT